MSMELSQSTKVVVHGLPDETVGKINHCLTQLGKLSEGNRIKQSYYDAENVIKHLGVEQSLQYRNVEMVLGWPTKAVDALSNLCHGEGYVVPGLAEASEMLGDAWRDNDLELVLDQVGTSSLIHGVAFLVTVRGVDGEPEALVLQKSARSATGKWNPRRRTLDFFLSVHEVDQNRRPTSMTFYEPGVDTELVLENGLWKFEQFSNPLGYVPVEPVVYRARTGEKPFGFSRINRPVRALADGALRTVVRSEIGAEIYANPGRALLGADEAQFKNPDGSYTQTFRDLMTRMAIVPPNYYNGDGEPLQTPITPTLHQFQQATMEPHLKQLEEFASQFAAATSLNPATLGVTSRANPTSAEAMIAGKGDLIEEAENTMRGWNRAVVRTGHSILRLLMKTNELPDEVKKMDFEWSNPAIATREQRVQSTLNLIEKGVLQPNSEVALRRMGFSLAEIDQIKDENRRNQGLSALQTLSQARAQRLQEQQQTPAIDATEGLAVGPAPERVQGFNPS